MIRPAAALIVGAVAWLAVVAWLARPLPEPGSGSAPGRGIVEIPLSGAPAPVVRPSLPAAVAQRADAAPAPAVVGAPPRLAPAPRPSAIGQRESAGPDAGPLFFRDPAGVLRPVPNLTSLEVEQRNLALQRATERIEAEARANPRAFALAHRLEEHEVREMLEGKRPFPEHLLRDPSQR